MEISIIVPVYNVEPYLRRSIDSLINQTIADKIEIILVDDGSTDDSGMICEEYSEKHSNIKVIHQVNGGVSVARNTGLKFAVGKYIAFVDADDYVSLDMYESLWKLAEREHADVAIVDFNVCHSDGSILKKRKETQTVQWNRSEAVRDFLAGKLIGINIFDKLYRRASVENIFFERGKAIGEDMYYLFQVVQHVDKIVADFSQTKYYYMVREGSAMQNKFSAKYFDTLDFSKKIVEETTEKYPEYVAYAEAHLVHEQCKTLERMYIGDGRTEFWKEYLLLKKQVKHYPLTKAYTYLSKKQFMGFLLMKISIPLYIKILIWMKI